MAVEKKIVVDGKEVLFKASAAFPRIYRNKYGRDIFADIRKLEGKLASPETLDLMSLDAFLDIAYLMAKSADPNIPDNADEWLDQFSMFSIYLIFPQLYELWGMNMDQQSESKKKSP